MEEGSEWTLNINKGMIVEDHKCQWIDSEDDSKLLWDVKVQT